MDARLKTALYIELGCVVTGLDRDPLAENIAKSIADKNFTFVRDSFSQIATRFQYILKTPQCIL